MPKFHVTFWVSKDLSSGENIEATDYADAYRIAIDTINAGTKEEPRELLPSNIIYIWNPDSNFTEPCPPKNS